MTKSAIELVPFHGDTLQATRDERGVWVSVRRVCEALGIDESRQRRKLAGKAWATTGVMSAVAEDGRIREVFCVHLDSLPMWLATIEASRVSTSVRKKLERYQCEAAVALRDHFLGGKRLDSPEAHELIRLTLRIEAIRQEDYTTVWERDLKLELARLRRIRWTGSGREPKGLSFAYGRTLRIILGDAVYEELKARNPKPQKGTLHPMWLQDDRIRVARREDLVIALVLARRSYRWAEYETEMRGHFRRAPIQLRLVASNTRRLPSKSRGA